MADMIKAKLNGKYEIILPKHRADRPEWYTEQGWEKPRLDHMHSTTKKGDVVYYVGAEEGDMCGLVAKWGAELVMFEPNERVSPNIKAIWSSNKLKNPLAYFEGFAANVTDLKGKDALHIGEFPASADGEVIGDHGFKELAYEHDVVPQIKIDDLVEQYGIAPPTMITFDCEGSDWEVLKGAEQTIRKYKPRIYASIHPEFMFRMFDQYSRDFRNWIIDLGYKETFLDYQHELHCYYEAI